MKREHILELKLNKIKNPCLSCIHLDEKRDSKSCSNCLCNNGTELNLEKREGN